MKNVWKLLLSSMKCSQFAHCNCISSKFSCRHYVFHSIAVQFVTNRLIVWLQANLESFHIQCFYFKLISGFRYRIHFCIEAASVCLVDEHCTNNTGA